MKMILPYKKIQDHYKELLPHIIERQQTHIRAWVSPGCDIDWTSYFTPIEKQAWSAIRYFGMVPMYPQYPAQGYFIDFANPYVKIGIECDGKQFHDKEKDLLRDTNLSKEGWIIYRISGTDCNREVEDDYYDINYKDEMEKVEILSRFYLNTLEGLLKAIAIFHFDYKSFDKELNELELARQCLKSRMNESIESSKRIPD